MNSRNKIRGLAGRHCQHHWPVPCSLSFNKYLLSRDSGAGWLGQSLASPSAACVTSVSSPGK